MQITVTDADGQAFALDLTGEAEVSALKDIISVELNIPPEHQRILLDGRPLPSSARTLADAGVAEGAMLLVFNDSAAAAAAAATGAAAAAAAPAANAQRLQQQQQQQLRPAPQALQRQQQRGLLPLDFSSIVVDGGRVAQFPAGGGPGPPRSPAAASAAAPAAASAAAAAVGPAARLAAPDVAAHLKLLVRRRAEEAVAAAVADAASLALIRAHNPVLGEAIKAAVDERQQQQQQQQQGEPGPAFTRLMDTLEKEYTNQIKAEDERWRRMAAIQRDPLSAEAQRMLLEDLQQERINENYSMAREHLPEGFGSVCMLYVHLEINGVACKAFVDSGAQQSILSLAFAEKCSLSSLIDKRFAGLALGVGRAPIIGRVHLAPLKLGSKFCPCSFIVLEDSKMQMLLGLDMLKRYQMVIDLKKNVLVVEGEEIPFLSEAQIDKGLFGTGESHEEVEAAAAKTETENGAK
ncbi:DNA-damage inducible protein, putative [Eimeria tenella]|uniref:DNA-damage inducible protein, putative n=1 Tax=Eimeria tenella TaxID=5802 RepID=U6L9I2_EIMTE|nr:DNA-damage inducible protein, putative [Eimeria tenella]CDJ45224.1 DNA-damage inducible protein, putative [Eimeria tenella]|eukprot:XP_013235971.1 DNA-damage inducible protein, putative [Eimeria tenella]